MMEYSLAAAHEAHKARQARMSGNIPDEGITSAPELRRRRVAQWMAESERARAEEEKKRWREILSEGRWRRLREEERRRREEIEWAWIERAREQHNAHVYAWAEHNFAQTTADRDEIIDTIYAATPAQAKRILIETAQSYGVEVSEILGHRRHANLIEARHMAIYRVAKATGWSLPRLGHLFNRDHSTIIHALRKMEAKMAAQGTDG